MVVTHSLCFDNKKVLHWFKALEVQLRKLAGVQD